ncbi:MAG: acireductone synthase [Pirellulaceae bacterium]|nr:acireductone synthase [Pirellulaceae bacterium]
MNFSGRGILLDIEGTTSSVSFVYDVMFPFVRRELDSFLSARWNDPAVIAATDLIGRDAGHADFRGRLDEPAARIFIEELVAKLMDGDSKTTGLKLLQGLIWEAGFQSGELLAHVYDDVPPALSVWNAAGIDVRIYSSGSVQAQKLFFGHSIAGNLLGQFRGHYDTTVGSKKEAASYRHIAGDFGLPPVEILFLSDIVAELDAARDAGFTTALCLRPGNAPAPASRGAPHPTLASFAEVQVGGTAR